MSVRAILFDVIGTTVIEKNSSVITECFEQAFRNNGIFVERSVIKANRGKDKRDAINEILQQLHYPTRLGDSILAAFKKNLENNLHNFSENQELRETMRAMRERKIIVGIGTGLPSDIFQSIFNYLNWSAYQFDYVGTAEKTGRGRPHPDMILDMMKTKKISPSVFLKVGDTVADIREGKNANVLTAAILSGTADEKELATERPDFIIRSLTDLIKIVT
jgi:phosphonoacetaldehyde hydrolase